MLGNKKVKDKLSLVKLSKITVVVKLMSVPRLPAHLEVLHREANSDLPFLPGILHRHLKIVSQPPGGRRTVSLNDTNVMPVLWGPVVMDGHLVGGYNMEQTRAVGGVQMRWHLLRIHLLDHLPPLIARAPAGRQAGEIDWIIRRFLIDQHRRFSNTRGFDASDQIFQEIQRHKQVVTREWKTLVPIWFSIAVLRPR